MACTMGQSPCAWRATCRRCPGAYSVAGPMWAAALGGCEWLESWKLGRTLDDAVLDLVRRLADAPLPDPPPILRALLGHTLDEVLLRGLTALYSLLGCEDQEQQPDGGSDGAAVSATWLAAQYQQLADDERRLGSDNPSIRERQATLNQLSQLLSRHQSLQDRDAATSTAAASSWEPSRASSVAGTSVAGDTDTAATVSSSASTVQEASPRLSSSVPETGPRPAGTVPEANLRRVPPQEERQLIERRQTGPSTMPDWILPGVAESEENISSSGETTPRAIEEGGGRNSKKVRFGADERGADGQRDSAARQSEAAGEQRQSGSFKAAPPCECCMSAQPARASAPAPAAPRSPCVCPCGKATRICAVRHPECVCDEPSSDYFTGRGTSAMPSRSDAVTADDRRKPSESAAAKARTSTEADDESDQKLSKPTDKRASSVRRPVSSAPPGEEVFEGASPDTDYQSAASTPRAKSAARPEPSAPPGSALWPRSAPCPCCPPRRRRPRGPANCPEQILWAVTKICVFPDASRTYEVLTPTFEKPPRASGRTHVVFAMRPP